MTNIVMATILAAELGCTEAELAGRGFHELGGSSLDAARTTLRLLRECHVQVAARDLLTVPDLAAFLAILDEDSTVTTAPVADPSGRRPTGSRTGVVPLTWQQRIVWYQTMLDPASARYHFHALFHFAATPDAARLRAALRRMLHRHPILRIRITMDGDEPGQLPPTHDVTEAETAIRVLDTANAQLAPEQIVHLAGGNAPFDLRNGPLVRWALVTRPDGTATLVHTEHHLVHDGMSFELLLATLTDTAGADGTADDTVVDDGYLRYATAPRCADAAMRDRATRVCQTTAHELFPARELRSAEPDAFLRLRVPQQLLDATIRTARRNDTSLFATLFAAFSAALARLTNHTDMVLGTAVSNRPPGFESTVGMFVATTPVEVGSAADDPAEHLRRTARSLHEAVDRADVPLSDTVAALGGPARDVDRNLIHAAFSMHEQHVSRIRLTGLQARVELGVFNGAAKFPLNAIALIDRSTPQIGCQLLIEGARTHVSDEQLWALWTYFIRWLTAVTEYEPYRTQAPVELDVVAAVRNHATRHADTIALDDDVEAISYADLADLGAAMRRRLVDIDRPAVVGVVGAASARFFATAYAVMHAGGSYVPLDDAQPADRLARMLSQVRCDLLMDLTTNGLGRRLAAPSPGGSRPAVLTWDELQSAAMPPDDDINAHPADTATDPDRPAYVVFTSGSSGLPKGVVVPRRALAALCAWAGTELELSAGMIVSQVANVGFDASCWEVWPALCAAARVRVVPESLRIDPLSLSEWLASHHVEVVFAPTPVAELLMRTQWPAGSRVRVLGAGGDALHAVPADVPFRVVNLYGPTECTVVSTAHRVEPGTGGTPPIGQIVPYGYGRIVSAIGDELHGPAEGELWIGGTGVAHGYVNQPFDTASRFVPDPYSPAGELVYRTGDLVARDEAGVLTFLGRRDRQVKISGARIDLGEIENIALGQPAVQGAVATVRQDSDRRHLRLFLQMAADAQPTLTIAQVRAALPPFVRHLTIATVSSLPLNRNGKVDLRMLTDPSRSESQSTNAADVAREYLDGEHLDGPWFQLGGSSLDAAKLVSRLEHDLGLSATLQDLLNAESVADFLRRLDHGLNRKVDAGVNTKLEGGPNGRRSGRDAATGERQESSAVGVLWPAVERLSTHEKLDLARQLVTSALTEIGT
jgi:amino acid adenylation domain-containing protein